MNLNPIVLKCVVLLAIFHCGHVRALEIFELSPFSIIDLDESYQLGDSLKKITLTRPSDVEALAVQLSVDIESDNSGNLYVYNDRGHLEQYIDTSYAIIWTEVIKGSKLEIVLDSNSPAIVTISKVAELRASGVPDGVIDQPNFKIVDESSSGFWVDYIKATGRLLVGKNEIDQKPYLPSVFREWCSGFLVSSSLFMTAAHCMKNREALCYQSFVLFGFEISSSALEVRACKEVVYMNAVLDIAILELTPTSNEVKYFSLPVVQEIGTQLAILHHPKGSVKTVTIDECMIIDSSTSSMPTVGNVDPSVYEKLGFSHSCDTDGGSSGSPVFSELGLIGVQQAGSKKVNFGIRADMIFQCLKILVDSNEVIVKKPASVACKNDI